MSDIVPQRYEEPCIAEASAGVSSAHSRCWHAAGASVQGTSHAKTGTGCQDSHFISTQADDILLAAVADGAGSASCSQIGSELAARTAVQELRRWVQRAAALPQTDEEWSTIMLGVLETARDAVERDAAARGLSPRDLASTLIVLMATPYLVAAGQIGDGAAVVADTENNLTALTMPQSGEYLNETTFLVSPRAMEEAQTVVWRGRVAFLAAFSDGLQMLALRMSDGTPHAPFFTPIFRFLEEQHDMEEAARQLQHFLTSARITQRADDDLTLLLARVSC